MSEHTASDRNEVAELFARLANLLDEGRHHDIGGVYHPDVVVRSPGGEFHGLSEATAFLDRKAADGERTQHLHGDVLVRLDGDHAEATANQFVHVFRDGAPPHRASGVRLSADAVRTPEGWRFSEMRINPAWIRES